MIPFVLHWLHNKRKIINKNNEIAINTKEQTSVHHSDRPAARLFMKPVITLFLAVVQPPYFKTPWSRND